MYSVTQTASTVLCCMCGVPIPSNPANMCATCIRSQVDITEGIQKQITMIHCKECGRYLQPPKAWVPAQLESKELLTLCLKKIKGLNKVKLVDAGFIWTEPHSKRLKVKLTIQKEVMNGTILQQTFQVEFVVENNMCDACTRTAANADQWVAVVQVRQHVEHKRTFLFLEQLILKHQAEQNTIGIKERPDGLDFFYANRSHALKFCEFLNQVVPIRSRNDKQLVSHDSKSNTHCYHFTFSVEIIPVCKDDLCLLPHKVYSSLGGLGPWVVVIRVSNTIALVDPITLRMAHQDASAYWRMAYKPVLTHRQLTEYIVLDVEVLTEVQGRHSLADVQVARKADFGANDDVYQTRCHFGHLLNAGDTCLGYDLSRANIVDPELDKYKSHQLPDVILVRKSYAEKRQKRRNKGQGQRQWTLKRMEMETDAGPPTGRRGADNAVERADAEREAFYQELEEDVDMRSRINLYRDPNAMALPGPPPVSSDPNEMDDDEYDEEGDVPEVPLEELLDALTVNDTVPQGFPQGLPQGPPGYPQQQEQYDDEDMDM